MEDSNVFLYNGTGMSEITDKYISIQEDLQSAYDSMKALYDNRLMGTTEWTGSGKEAVVSFMDLVLQYHKDLLDNKDGKPLQSAIDILLETQTNVGDITTNIPSYAELEAIE